MFVHILCRKYKEEIQTGTQPSRKRRLQESNIGGGPNFPKFDYWISDAINYAQQQGQDLTIEEMNLSRPPHIYAYRFSGMWAYGSHLRVEEKDTGKVNCDCVVSAEFHHDTGKNFYVGFIQEIIKVDYGETSPILLNCKWIKPSAIQHDEYGFLRANTRQILSKTDEPYVSPLQINQAFLIDDIASPGWSYVIQMEPRSKRKFMQCVDTIVDGQCNSLPETLEEEVEDVDRVFEEETFLPNEEIEIENVMHG